MWIKQQATEESKKKTKRNGAANFVNGQYIYGWFLVAIPKLYYSTKTEWLVKKTKQTKNTQWQS